MLSVYFITQPTELLIFPDQNGVDFLQTLDHLKIYFAIKKPATVKQPDKHKSNLTC